MTAAMAQFILLVLASACLAITAVIDVNRRIIPNELVVCILALGTMLRLLDNGVSTLWSLMIAAIAFVPLGYMAQRGAIGGGDAKMIAATMLLVEPSRVFALMTSIALAGGVLGIGQIVYSAIRLRPAADPDSAAGRPAIPPANISPRDAAGLPYGLAILGGAMLTLWWQP